ncbi:hypothetical protein DL98DRAFT_405120 [Cadophora sp. DSE1049]|nr:hypothetical protein DL98DRAFT_405120 [Cadophora sp. DSE1049]
MSFSGTSNPPNDSLQNLGPIQAQNDASFHAPADSLPPSIPGSHVSQPETLTTFIGRSHYITPDIHIDEASARAYPHLKNDGLSEASIKTLELWGSFNLPQRATSQSLFDAYMDKCYPWAPVIRPEDLANFDQPNFSLLLKQAIFVAGSRVTSGPGVIAYASTSEFYQRAKALFWQTHENDPLTVITSCVLLQWYNPDGPEHVTFDGSGFWLQIAVGLSRQVGLHKETAKTGDSVIRRRLWWTLVVRDCLLSVGQGRPRALSLKDSDVKPLRFEDFPESNHLAELFIPYVDICMLLASLTESCSRKHLSHEARLYLEASLFKWSRTLPGSLRTCQETSNGGSESAPYNFNARQLHLPFFTTIAMLSRAKSDQQAPSPATILASSFVVGIFEDILARDEQKFLPSIFTFYVLAAGVALVPLRQYPPLWIAAQQDLEILQTALDQLGQRWPSARGAKIALQNVIRQTASSTKSSVVEQLVWLDREECLLFEGFPTTLCRLWQPLESLILKVPPTSESPPPIVQNGSPETSSAPDHIMQTTFYDPIVEGLESLQYDGIGNW